MLCFDVTVRRITTGTYSSALTERRNRLKGHVFTCPLVGTSTGPESVGPSIHGVRRLRNPKDVLVHCRVYPHELIQ